MQRPNLLFRPKVGLVGLLLSLSLFVYCLTLPANVRAADAEKKTREEPPFPHLTDFGRDKVKIVSEIVDERNGVQTCEEYHDTDALQSAYYSSSASWNNVVSTNSASIEYSIKYLDHASQLAYAYRPFSCQVRRITELSSELYDQDGEWNYNERMSRLQKEFRFFGVYGLWWHANNGPKSFAESDIIYSASKDIHRKSLVWTSRDEERKLDIKLFYIEHKPKQPGLNSSDAKPELSLEMIRVEVDDNKAPLGKRLVRTINVVSIEHKLDEQVYSDLFQPPVGFGCLSSLIEEGNSDLIDPSRLAINTMFQRYDKSHLAELEITATKYTTSLGNDGAIKLDRKSDTYNVEVAQAQIKGFVESSFIELIRWRNTREDKKMVVNHMLGLLYAIDMRYGSCEMSHFNSNENEHGQVRNESSYSTHLVLTDELAERVLLRFQNSGLEFEASTRLFDIPANMHLIRRTPASDRQPELIYYEGTGLEALKGLTDPTKHGSGRLMRTIHTYTRQGNNAHLHSITIWVLNEEQNRLLESYQINIVEARELVPGWPDEPKHFDVSEECYLENEQMHQNRDYAWLELTYPVPNSVLNKIANNQLSFKQFFYERAIKDFTQAPRVEMVFEEDSFVIRTLMLDLPATELIYDRLSGQLLDHFHEHDDFNYQAPDLSHCGHYCRIHDCTVMSYCATHNLCRLSTRLLPVQPIKGQEADEGAQQSKPFSYQDNNACDSYVMPLIVFKNQLLKRSRLQVAIAALQHQNYAPEMLPKIPEELILPRSESGLSESDYMSVLREYDIAMGEHLERNNRLAELKLLLSIDGHFLVLLPSKFELDKDPLSEFDIYEKQTMDATDEDNGDEDGLRVPRFHEGVSGSRYNLAKASKEGVEFRQFTGLTYDQCAMACADSKCGSFSFCKGQGAECILTNIETTGQAKRLDLLRPDSGCLVMQRDFLANFNKFDSVYRPQTYAKTEDAGDASECAMKCVAESDFACLSFEFCSKSSNKGAQPGVGQCYYQTVRHMPGSGQVLAGSSKMSNQAPRPLDGSPTDCDHYSRSYLADFLRLESRKVAEPVLDKLKTSTFNGVSVFKCAEICAIDLIDCSGFQFCNFQEVAGSGSKSPRSCTTIESGITRELLGTAGQGDLETIVDEREGGRVVKAGSYLESEPQCQVFALRKDTSEAHLRDLAFGGLLKTEREKETEGQASTGGSGGGSGGLTFWSGLLLYIAVASVSAAAGFVAIKLRDNSLLVHGLLNRLRTLLRR